MDYRSWWSCLLIFVCKRLAWSTCTLRTRRFGWTNMTLSGGTTCTAFLRFSTSSNCTVFSFCKCMNVHKCKHAFLLCSIANGTSGTVSLPLPFFWVLECRLFWHSDHDRMYRLFLQSPIFSHSFCTSFYSAMTWLTTRHALLHCARRAVIVMKIIITRGTLARNYTYFLHVNDQLLTRILTTEYTCTKSQNCGTWYLYF